MELARAGGSLYTIKLKSACREPDLSLSGLDPVPLSKIGTRLLASLGSKAKNRNSVACLRNAGSYSAVTYCTFVERVHSFDNGDVKVTYQVEKTSDSVEVEG